MRNKNKLLFVSLLLTCSLLTSSLFAAQLDIEEQARQIAANLRCPVCQNLSAADSPSELAQQMRAIILEQLKEGKSPVEIKAYFVTKYGEWVLLAPTAKGFGLLIWVLPFVAVVSGIILVLLVARRWAGKKDGQRTSAVEPSLIAQVKREAAMETPPQVDLDAESPRSELLQEQSRLYADLRELEFDYQTGRLSERDYQDLRGKMETEAALVLKKLEASSPGRPDASPKAPERKPAPAEKKAVEMQKGSRPAWQLVAGGTFLLLFGITIGVLLTKSLRPRTSEQDSMTGGFLTGTGSGDVGKGENDVASLLGQGRAAFERQEWPKAIEIFKKVLAVEPNHSVAHTYMGLILAQAGHVDDALLAFDRALSADPKFPLALWSKGMLLYRAKEDFSGARETLQSLLSMMPPGTERNEIQKSLVEIAELASQKKGSLQKTKVESSPQLRQIHGTISIDPKLKSKLDAQAVLFIIVHSANSTSGPPLAVKKIEHPVFPLPYTVGPENVMMPGLSLSGKVQVSARLDKDGNPMTKEPGNLTGEYKKNPVEVGSQNVDIVIDHIM